MNSNTLNLNILEKDNIVYVLLVNATVYLNSIGQLNISNLNNLSFIIKNKIKNKQTPYSFCTVPASFGVSSQLHCLFVLMQEESNKWKVLPFKESKTVLLDIRKKTKQTVLLGGT